MLYDDCKSATEHHRYKILQQQKEKVQAEIKTSRKIGTCVILVNVIIIIGAVFLCVTVEFLWALWTMLIMWGICFICSGVMHLKNAKNLSKTLSKTRKDRECLRTSTEKRLNPSASEFELGKTPVHTCSSLTLCSPPAYKDALTMQKEPVTVIETSKYQKRLNPPTSNLKPNHQAVTQQSTLITTATRAKIERIQKPPNDSSSAASLNSVHKNSLLPQHSIPSDSSRPYNKVLAMQITPPIVIDTEKKYRPTETRRNRGVITTVSSDVPISECEFRGEFPSHFDISLNQTSSTAETAPTPQDDPLTTSSPQNDFNTHCNLPLPAVPEEPHPSYRNCESVLNQEQGSWKAFL